MKNLLFCITFFYLSCNDSGSKTAGQTTESKKSENYTPDLQVDTLTFVNQEELNVYFSKKYDSIATVKKSGKTVQKNNDIHHDSVNSFTTFADIDRQRSISFYKLLRNKQKDLQHFRAFANIVNSQYISLSNLEELYLSFPEKMRNQNANFYKKILEERKLVEGQKNVTSEVYRHKFWNEESKKFQTLNDVPGDLLIINFWASWCTPCRYKNEFLLKNKNEIEGLGFTMVAISLDTDKSKWIEAHKKDKISFLDLLDSKGFDSEISRILKIKKIPFIVILNKDGKVLGINIQEQDLLKKLKQIAAAYVVNDTKQATTK